MNPYETGNICRCGLTAGGSECPQCESAELSANMIGCTVFAAYFIIIVAMFFALWLQS